MFFFLFAIEPLSSSLEGVISEFRIHEMALNTGLRGCILLQPALQDEPRRSGGVLGPSLAENRPNT